jgi:cell division protein FtsN
MENFDENLNEESKGHIRIPGKNKLGASIKNIVLFLLLIALIVGSFWVSFNLGKKILSPVKKPEKKIDVAIPEPPPSIAGLQSLEELEVVEEKTVMAPKEKVEPVVTQRIPSVGPYYKVQAGYFNNKNNALNLSAKLQANGVDTFVRKIGKGYRVQAGAYSTKKWAIVQRDALKRKGFDAIIIFE